MAEPISIQTAVANAMQEQINASTANKQESTEEITTSNKSSEETSENNDSAESTTKGTSTETSENVIEVDASPEEINQALALMKNMTNPETQRQFVENMAQQLGIIQKETGASKTEIKNQTLDILNKHLGEENSYLSEQLAGAIDELLDIKVNKPLSQTKLEQKAQEVKTEVDRVYEKMSTAHSDFQALEPKIVELMAEISPGPKATMESYLERLYNIAKGNSPVVDVKKEANKQTAKTIAKITKNAKETAKNVSSDVDEARVQKGSHRPTAREAVLNAMKDLTK